MSEGAFFNEAAREAAARAICDQGILALNGSEATWERHVDGFRRMAADALNAALEALPERSKAILALAALSDEELVRRGGSALMSGIHGPIPDSERDAIVAECRHDAATVLTALGLPAEPES